MTEAEERPRLSDGRYELLSVSGKGGVATVWRAKDRESGQPVAIKILQHSAVQVELELLRRLAQEVGILTKLHHPCIIRVLATGVTACESPYVVMEWVDGMTLRDRLAATPVLPPADVIDLVNQICSALSEAHAHGVIHRDLKPENVLLCAPDHLAVKVVDFGMAKLLDAAAPTLTFGDDGLICGTPQYMPPERARALPVGAAADVYAVGLMTYEMLTGRRPFDGPSATRVLLQQVNDPVPPMRTVPAALEEVVLSALAKEPENRPSAAEFAHALEHTCDRRTS